MITLSDLHICIFQMYTVIRIFLVFLVFLARVKASFRNLHRPHVSRPIGHSGAHKTVKFHVAEFGGERERGREVERCRNEPHSRAGLKFESHGTR